MSKSVQSRALPGEKAGRNRTDSTREGECLSIPNRAVLKFLGEIGRKGGQAKVPKGTALLSAEERTALGQKAARARWGKKKAANKKRTAAK